FDAPPGYHTRVRDEHVGLGHFQEGEFDDPTRIHHTSYHGGGGIEGAGSAPSKACKEYSDAYWHRLRRTYFANVALIDDWIGALLAAVERRFHGNALVLFTTDHGEMLGNHRLWGKNNCAYEDVWNVPLLARFPAESPGATLHGTSTDAMVSLVDVTPTCLRAVGVDDLPLTDGSPLEDQIGRGGRPYVLAEGEGFMAISDGRTKYVTATRGTQRYRELLDLDADPHEFRNVIDRPEYAARQAEVERTLLDVLVDALLP
ncbi:MAG TPA: sulfatase-like hydrolase/transferase, partial [Chloroflexota bacterium]|nr:sulfatase-like hydrolase/transferase [Chloroflexota bacterium]